MMTPTEFEVMEREGLVTIDSGLTPAEVSAAAAAMDRHFGDKPDGFSGNDIFDPAMLHILQHPLLVRVAQQMLRTDRVRLRGMALRKTSPKPTEAARLEGEHADIRYAAADLDATPRRMLCTVLVWLTDVTSRRAPFMYRPGSHRQLADTYEGVPRVDAFHLDKLPKLPYAQPVPALARAGQISVGTTGVIHSGSINTDTQDRKVVFLQFESYGVPQVIFNEQLQKQTDQYFAKVRELIDPSRHHLFV